MNCKQFDRMLHLNRPGELSAREAELLLSHLKTCRRCALEKVRIEQADMLIERARRTVPLPSNPDQLIAVTMRGVRAAASKPLWVSAIERVLDFFWQPSVRYASMAVIVAAIGLFTFQFLTMFNDIYKLELSAKAVVHKPMTTGTYYSVESGSLKELATSTELHSLLPSGTLKSSNGQTIVRQSDITSVLSAYGLRSMSTSVASSVLHIDKRKLEQIIDDVTKNAKTFTEF